MIEQKGPDYFIRVHYSEGTVDIHIPDHASEWECAVAAKQIMSSGVYDDKFGPQRNQKRFYPPSSIVYAELVPEVIES